MANKSSVEEVKTFIKEVCQEKLARDDFEAAHRALEILLPILDNGDEIGNVSSSRALVPVIAGAFVKKTPAQLAKFSDEEVYVYSRQLAAHEGQTEAAALRTVRRLRTWGIRAKRR